MSQRKPEPAPKKTAAKPNARPLPAPPAPSASRPFVTAAALAREPPTTSPERLRALHFETGVQDGLDLDVAIVGAGVSGLYSAFRLTTAKDGASAYPPGGVQVFEMSDRIGGRLLSVKLPGLEITGELGGMRYLRSQRIVTTLIEKVFKDELTPIDFPMGTPAQLFGYFRKQHMRLNAWEEAQAKGEKLVTRYQLNEDDLGFSSDQLFNKIAYDVLTADPWFNEKYPGAAQKKGEYDYVVSLSDAEWNEVKTHLTYHKEGSPYDGMKLNDLGFWNVLKDQVSEEGYNFLADAGGYYSNTINWNAAEAFPYMISDFGSSTKYYTIQGGYDLIAYALAQAYMAKKGAAIRTRNRLVTFTRSLGGKRRYALVFYNEAERRTWTVHADKIVLAMPRRSLELLDQQNFFFDRDTKKHLQTNIASVIMQPSYKILMGYDSPWWKEDFGTLAGHSVTDLPMRQCYYFGTDPNDTRSMLLGSYNDMRTVPFWEVLAQRAGLFRPRAPKPAEGAKNGALRSHLDATVEKELRTLGDVQAPKAMVAEVVAQLRELHARPDIPEPYVTWFKDWTEDPYGGGYHCWRAGFDVKSVMRYMRQPDANESIHVCGEAYSDQQGWVEGAFCTAELMLREHFGLKAPRWFPEDYNMGW